jgi:hypothetical protein
MSTVMSVIAYVLLVIGLAVCEKYLGILTKAGLLRGPYIVMGLFCVYLVMLYLEVNRTNKAKESYDKARRRNSIFSFSIGVIWGVIMSFAGGYHYSLGPVEILLILMECLGIGGLFYLLGRVLTRLLWKF